ncbi:MAG: NTP transferase domain-containing protein [Saprospiraceae bacterium]
MTTIEKHNKHPKLKRPTVGCFHHAEWAIYGTTCGNIEQLWNAINNGINTNLKIAYIDADHSEGVKDTKLQIGKKTISQSTIREWNTYDDKLNTNHLDAVIVNGNHYQANQQIVVLDPKKKDSLYRRINQLDNIKVIIKTEDDIEIYDFLQDKIDNETLILSLTDTKGLIKYINSQLLNLRPKLKALILGGGKSQRMGKDKSQLIYNNNRPQQLYIADLCAELNIDTYISKQHDYPENKIDQYSVINDRLIAMGPFGAIVSAMMYDPDSAWLVIACDLPYIDKASINRLIKNRDASKYATATIGIGNPFPEPLISIYEPKIYSRFLQFMALGYSCPRKVLINSEVKTVEILDNKTITNVNTLDEDNQVRIENNKKA